LRKWDGLSFATLAEESMLISYGPESRITPANPGETTAGFSLAVSDEGTWHRHLGYTLSSPASEGIYLLSLELISTDIGIAKSDPFYIVFNQNASESLHEAAIEFTRSQIVPEPTTLGALAFGLLLVRRRPPHADPERPQA